MTPEIAPSDGQCILEARLGRRNRYRLSTWPELAGFVKRGTGASWVPCRRAGQRILEELLGQYPNQWYQDRFFECDFPRFRLPRIRRLDGGEWADREDGQGLFPWGIEYRGECAEAARYDAARAFQRLIPGRLRVLVKRFRFDHITLLRLLSSVPDSEELARGNPAMFFLLARRFDRPSASAIPRDEVRQWLRRPRRELLAFLVGHPVPQASVNVIAKIPHQAIEPETVSNLMLTPHQPFGKCLQHRRTFTPALVRVAANPWHWPFLTSSLLHEIGDHPGHFDHADPESALELIAGKLWRLGGPDCSEDFPRFRSAAEIRKFLRQFTPLHDLMPTSLALPDETPLPAPPVPGDADILPLTSIGAMREEGRVRRNCVGEEWQIERARAGQCHAYRMLRPERATIMISPDADGNWNIEDIRGYANAPTLIATVRHAVNALRLPAQPAWLPMDVEGWWNPQSPFAFVPEPAPKSA